MTAPTPLRVLYAGTPETAVPVLRALLDSPHAVSYTHLTLPTSDLV